MAEHPQSGETTEDTAILQGIEAIKYIVTRRSKRSTAGNRMDIALAEMLVDIQNTKGEEEEDKDFEAVQDEQDLFESDFASTDEDEAAHGNASDRGQQAGGIRVTEKDIQREERRGRQTARIQLEKTTAAAHERNKATFHPELYGSKSRSKAKQVAIELPDDENWDAWGLRKSQRTNAVLERAATAQRLKANEDKLQARAPRRTKTVNKSFTQSELLSRALDNEQGNIVEHKDYLKIEEEKRRKARVVKKKVRGQMVRVVSRLEKEEVKTYVVYTLGKGARKPVWTETMEALLGDHVDWSEVRAYDLDDPKRPISRPIYRCPITGKPARYCDPETGVRYADKRGFESVRKVLKREYSWNPVLKCFDGMDSDSESEYEREVEVKEQRDVNSSSGRISPDTENDPRPRERKEDSLFEGPDRDQEMFEGEEQSNPAQIQFQMQLSSQDAYSRQYVGVDATDLYDQVAGLYPGDMDIENLNVDPGMAMAVGPAVIGGLGSVDTMGLDIETEPAPFARDEADLGRSMGCQV